MGNQFADDPRALQSSAGDGANDRKIVSSISGRCFSALMASIASLLLAFCCAPAGAVLGYMIYQRATGLIEEIAMTNLGRENVGMAQAARLLAIIGLVLSLCSFIASIARVVF